MGLETTAAAKMVRARAGLVLDAPFFGALALRQVLRADPTCDTAWTDGATLGYNPAYVDALSLDECKGLLAHEVLHVALAHHARRGNRNPRKWNRAADHAANQLARDARFVLPAGALPGVPNESAEAIYNGLSDEPEDGQGQGGQGQADTDPGKCGEVRDAPGTDGKPATEQQLAQAEAESKVNTMQAAQAAKAAGKLPGGIGRLIEKMQEPNVPWREVLRRFVDTCARNDYTWKRPNSRYMASGLYLPSLYSEEVGQIAVAVDTSGSIDNEAISQFAAELSAVVGEVKATVTVMYCDTQVHNVEEFSPEQLPLDLHPQGGGGTDFRPPFAEVEQRGLQPKCLIYLTDGWCSRFPAEPEYPVLWAVLDNDSFRPPFGERVAVS